MNTENKTAIDLDIVSADAEPKVSAATSEATLEERALSLEHDRARLQQELGIVGRYLGGRQHAPIYVVGLIGIFALLGLLTVGVTTDELRPELFRILGAIVMAVLGYLGGIFSGGK